ncbi:hypothetical protein BT69DRAFT_521224 [Atractiella rhizophila]|nr:hypothetical protein BT69DRAFT_521224 [Atractiella rhizophila]
MFPSSHNAAKQRNHFSFGSFEQQINLVVSFRDSPDLNTSTEPQSLGENLNTLNNVSSSPSSSTLPIPSPFTVLPSTRPNNFLSLSYNSAFRMHRHLPQKIGRREEEASTEKRSTRTNERKVIAAMLRPLFPRAPSLPDVPSGSEHPLPFQVPSVGHGTHLLPAACIDPPSVTSLLVSTSPFVRSFEILRPSLAAPLGPLQPFPLVAEVDYCSKCGTTDPPKLKQLANHQASSLCKQTHANLTARGWHPETWSAEEPPPLPSECFNLHERLASKSFCHGILISPPDSRYTSGSIPTISTASDAEDPFTYVLNRNHDTLISTKCVEKLTPYDISIGETRCHKCRQLLLDPSVKKIQKRKNRPVEKALLICQNAIYLVDHSRKVIKRVRSEKLKGLNQCRDHEQTRKRVQILQALVIAIEQSNCSRIPEIVRRCRLRKMRIQSITDLVIRATDGSYRMRSYSEKIIKVATIVKAYGGRIPLEVLRKQFGEHLPSRTTIWRHDANARIRLSHDYPTRSEMRYNLDIFFPMSSIRQTGQCFGEDDMAARILAGLHADIWGQFAEF